MTSSGRRPSIRPTQALLNKLRHRFTGYFRAYYKTLREEIRKALEEGRDPSSVPHYCEGYKKIQVSLCRDGVIAVHLPADEGAARDRFEFYLTPGLTVEEMAARYNPPLPGGDTMGPLIDYRPGDHFGPVVFAEPRQRATPMEDGSEVTVEDQWHRLDMVSLSRVGAYFDEKEARRQARMVFASQDERRGPDAPNELEGPPGPPSGLSDHPTDHLIREIVRTRQSATDEEVERILECISLAPFVGEVRVPPRHRGIEHRGRAVRAREDSLFYHLAKRVDEGQWAEETTEEEYLEDLRDAASSPAARLVLYSLRGGNVAAVVSDNRLPAGRLGPDSLQHVFVAYSADRGTIITGYQVSGLERVNVSEEPLWLR